MSEDTVMKHKRFLFLLTAAVAFIIQLIDIISYTIKFSITQTFILVIVQMIGLVGYAYDARNVVKNNIAPRQKRCKKHKRRILHAENILRQLSFYIIRIRMLPLKRKPL